MSVPSDHSQRSAKAPQVAADSYELDSIAEDGISDRLPSPLRSGYTRNDRRDMHRMGKNQELMRMFRFLSTVSFTAMIQCSWEYALLANYQGLVDGGMAGMFYSYLWTYAGFILIVLSLAEMASMAPTSGGQYHWVSEFAPAKYQHILSYLTGWMATLSWQAGSAANVLLIATVSQQLIVVNQSSYEPQRWQGTLFAFAVTSILFSINTWGARALSFLQNILLVLHVFGWIAVVIILWMTARIQSAKTVFTQFENLGGWSSMGLTLMVGQVNAAYFAIGSDSAAHMSEEVKDAGSTVPRAMLTSFAINGVMALITLITFLFCIPNVQEAISDPSGFPYLYSLRYSISDGAVTGISVLLLTLLLACGIDGYASASRQTFAFARDHGLPFSRWISIVHSRLHVPVNAIAITSGCTILLSLINIGNKTAFNAIAGLSLNALMMTYMISIGCVLYRRLMHPELLPFARWSLGRYGSVINAGGLIYSTHVFFWAFWPIATPVTLDTVNWAALIFSVIIIVSGANYLFFGRKNYIGPVALVKNIMVSARD